MVRFVDLTDYYWLVNREEAKADGDDPPTPICAFISTVDDCFLENDNGSHTFESLEEIGRHPQAKRLLGLVPENFFTGAMVWSANASSAKSGGRQPSKPSTSLRSATKKRGG